MTEEFFLCQKSYGNTIRMIFFYTHENFSVTGPGIFGRTDQKKIQYDQRPTHMIFWKQANFCESKLLWAYNDLKFIFRRFIRF